MATNPHDPPIEKPTTSSTSVRAHTRRTSFPILAGVLLGMVAWCVFANLESPSFYRLSVWILNETSPKALFAMPAYECLQRVLVLALAGIGGCVGIAFSNWPYTKCILFLSGILILMAVVATLVPWPYCSAGSH
jgi:hypothetical protein